MTSQMYTLNAKLSALLALLKVRKADNKIIEKVNKFSGSVRDALDVRNRLVHDMWFNDNFNQDKMGKLRITADKKLHFHIDTIPIEQLQQDNQILELRRTQIGGIREEIKAVLATLPEIPHSELYPITENSQEP